MQRWVVGTAREDTGRREVGGDFACLNINVLNRRLRRLAAGLPLKYLAGYNQHLAGYNRL